MVILGLTGSIGMGKSTAAAAFRRAGVPVYDADAAVHRLMARGGPAVPLVEAAFPDVVKGRAVDREALGKRVFGDAEALSRLESIVHPLVRDGERRFLQRAAAERRDLVVLDVPLLFETGGESRCDAVVVVTAPGFLQSERVLSRPGMTRERFEAILARQMPDAEKRRRADFIVLTGLDRSFGLRRVNEIVRVARTWEGRNWPPAGRLPAFRMRSSRAKVEPMEEERDETIEDKGVVDA